MSENNFEYDQPILCLLKMILKQVSFVLLGYVQACHWNWLWHQGYPKNYTVLEMESITAHNLVQLLILIFLKLLMDQKASGWHKVHNFVSTSQLKERAQISGLTLLLGKHLQKHRQLLISYYRSLCG